MNLARRMLGRPYGVQGSVVRGDARGQGLGFPTANIDPQNRVIPCRGVYVSAILIDKQWRQSVTNVGVRPTFGDTAQSSIETHVLDWSDDLYGRTVRVRFLHRLRDEKKFSSIDELKSQIERDVARAGRYFERDGIKRSLAIV